LGGLRHAIETDRFGIVAHVLAARDGCTEEHCDTFRLLRDTSQVSDNLSGRKYESYVMHHATEWFQSALSAMAANTGQPSPGPSPVPAPVPALPPNAAPAASAKTASGGLYFPSSASIPPVSIMNAEPTGPPQPGAAAADGTAKPPTQAARKPTAQQARRPINLASPGSAPTPPPTPTPGPGSDE
jgi:hypothetical protein